MDEMQKEWEEKFASIHETRSSQKMTEFYDERADIYEKHVKSFKWDAPLETAKTAAELYPSNRENIRVLDVAAGTGLVAEEMAKFGFKLMDGLDSSDKMLDVARKAGLYGRYICDYIGNNKLDIENDTYDLITISGGLYCIGLSDLVAGMRELIRVTKPGAYFIMTSRRWHFSFDGEPKTDIEKEFSIIEQEGLWECISKTKIFYMSIEPGAVAIYHKK